MTRKRPKQNKARAVAPKTAATAQAHWPAPQRVIGGTADDLLRDAHDETVSWLRNDRQYRGHRECFLIGRGWSATPERLKQVKAQGFLTCAINNYPRDFRPDLWVTGDPPNYFGRWIWENVNVQKFIPLECAEMPCPQPDVDSPKKTPRDYGNVHFYHHVTNIDARNFFMTPYAQWGTMSYGPDDKDRPRGGVRSSMIAALRILFHLGIRTVYLLGCDFTPHDHPDENYFKDLAEQFRALRPVFDEAGFNVVQTNLDSHLREFDQIAFDEILAEVAV